MHDGHFFTFLQQQPGAAHIATSGNHTNAGNGPARFTKYEQNAGGSRVVAMLEKVLAESEKILESCPQSEAKRLAESYLSRAKGVLVAKDGQQWKAAWTIEDAAVAATLVKQLKFCISRGCCTRS